MSNQIDSSIPVLTEIIPAEHFLDTYALTGHATAPASIDNAAQGNDNDASKDRISAEEWQQLEQTLRENVLKQVLSRIDFVLEHRIRDSLADVLQTAVETLAIEIRAGLHKTLEEVITRAVTQEISKARINK